MKLVTFNIRYDCNKDGINNFCFRKTMILEKLRKEMPEIICFQEVLPHVAVWLKEVLPEYYVVGCPREVGLIGEQTCIAFRFDKLSLIKLDNYWLSPTPYVPGSRYEVQSSCPRICTEATFHDLDSNKIFRLTNTHLDHEGHPARLIGVEQILAKLKNEPFFPDVPCILVGDMNADPDSEEMRYITDNSKLANLTEHIGTTFHGFMKAAATIDYIFADPVIRCRSITRWTDSNDGVFLSDHYPICAELELV